MDRYFKYKTENLDQKLKISRYSILDSKQNEQCMSFIMIFFCFSSYVYTIHIWSFRISRVGVLE